MILFVGQVGRDMAGREAFQEIEYRVLFSDMAKSVEQIEEPARIPEIVSRAFHTATNGRAGPVVVALPEDMLTDPQVLANDMLVELNHDLTGPQTQVGPIIKMSATPLSTDASPPLGRDTDKYAKLAGYSDAEILGLREVGTLA